MNCYELSDEILQKADELDSMIKKYGYPENKNYPRSPYWDLERILSSLQTAMDKIESRNNRLKEI